jgi:hypothetical protein
MGVVRVGRDERNGVKGWKRLEEWGGGEGWKG